MSVAAPLAKRKSLVMPTARAVLVHRPDGRRHWAKDGLEEVTAAGK